MTLPIKLIKLSNGDSLVAKIDVNEDKEYATIKQPVRIHRWMSPAGPEAGVHMKMLRSVLRIFFR